MITRQILVKIAWIRVKGAFAWSRVSFYEAMTLESAALLTGVIALVIYLLATLIFPERF